MNPPSFWLRNVAMVAMAGSLCHCSSAPVQQAWRTYDPLRPPLGEMSDSLEEEASSLQGKLAKHPGSERALLRLADIRFLQGRETEAVQLYRKALGENWARASAEDQARYGTALLHAERNDEARVVLEKALEQDPKNARALLSYAEYQANIVGDNAFAKSLLDRARRSGGIYIPQDFEQSLTENLN